MVGMFNARCNVWRFTEGAPDAQNEPAKTWAITTTSAPCRIEGMVGKEQTVGKQVVNATNIIFSLTSLSVEEQDRLEINSRFYEVIYVNREPGGVSGHHYEILANEVRT